MIRSLLKFFGFSGQAEQRGKKSKKDILDEQIAKSIEDFKNRPVHENITREIIDNASDDDLLQMVIESLIFKFPKDNNKEHDTVLSWTKSQQATYMVWYLEAEVFNGGFNQYYSNSSGRFSKLTPEALGLIGANRFADLMIKSNEIHETENEAITRHQDGTLAGFSKSYIGNPLNELDKEFYELSKSENLEHLQVDFIRRKKLDFIDK